MEGATREFLYRVQATRPAMLTDGPTDKEAAAVGRHFEYLKGLTEEGVAILVGRTLNTDPSCFGIVVFRAGTEDDARRIMEADPAVVAGVMRAELFPFRVALVGKG